MDAENKLQRIQELNRLRQQTYYNKHKELINAKRRSIYKIGKEKLKPEEQPIKEIPSEKEVYQTDFSKSKTISYEDIVNGLTSLDISDGSRNKYKSDIKRLMTLTECTNIITCFKDYKKLINIINNSTKPNGDPYSTNTKKSLFQMILFFIDKLNIPISAKIKQQYNKQFEILKISSNDETIEKQETVSILSFNDYLEKVKTEYGEDSKMYVLSSLYKEVTLRDNFILKIISSSKEATDEKENFIVIPKKGNLILIINKYKTVEKYGVIKVKLSKELSNLIKNYINREKLVIGDYLFGDKPLTSFVSSMNKKIGVTGGISLYRQMSVSTLLQSKPTAEARQKLAESMKHSPLTQLNYLRTKLI